MTNLTIGVILIILLNSYNLFSQVSAYTFAQANTAYTAIAGGTVHGAGAIDDNSYNNINIGFTFRYNCVDYTSVSINCNGFLALGASVSNSYTPISGGASNNVISVLGFDLQGNAAGELRSQTIGVAPNRTFIVQWTNFRAFASTGDVYNFQIRLNETSNTVQLHYGAFTQNATDRLAQVGLRGASNADFNNRIIGANPQNWTASAAGTINTDNCFLRTAKIPDNGRRFTYTPTAAAMSYTSSTCSQLLTGNVKRCPGNSQIIKLEVVMSSGCPINLTQVVVGAAGSTNITNDVSFIKVYYTGTTNSFNTSNLMNAGGTAPAGASTNINGSIPLQIGTNYFWITYDISGVAGIGNIIDASCTGLTINATGRVPSVTSPAGSATVIECASPGGVSAGLQTWLKADLGYTAGAPAIWSNQAPGTPALINGTANPAKNTVSTTYNYNPYIEFTGPASANTPGGAAANREFIRLSGLDLNVGVTYRSLFFSFNLTDLTRANTHLATTADVTTWGVPAVDGTLHGGAFGASATMDIGAYDPLDFGTSSAANTWKRNGTNGPFDAIHFTSKHILSAVTATANGVTLNRFLGGQNDNFGFNGDPRDWRGPVGEIIGYTTQLTAAEQNRVRTYLAIKYGVTLSGNYLSTSGGVIYTTAAPYDLNVIGIGRDDIEELNQKQSHQDDDTVRIYMNTIAASNSANAATFTNNISYIVQGSDNRRLCNTPSAMAEMPVGLANCALVSRLEREWKVTRTNMAQNYNMDVKLNACGTPSSVNIADLRFLVDTDGNFGNGGTQCFYNGDGTGIVITYNNPTITISNISTTHIPNNATRFITIASVDLSTPLPMELVLFDVKLNEKETVDLNWKTSSETDNDYFTVEKSTDGLNWNFLEKVDGAGTTSLPQTYYLEDKYPYSGYNYYQLKQTDFGGNDTYSDIKVIKLKEMDGLVIFPNPTMSVLNIKGKDIFSKKIEIVNNLGQIINVEKHFVSTDYLEINVEHLASGLYWVRVVDGVQQNLHKLIIRH